MRIDKQASIHILVEWPDFSGRTQAPFISHSRADASLLVLFYTLSTLEWHFSSNHYFCNVSIISFLATLV